MSTTTATERSPGEQLAAQAKTLVQNSDFAGAECLLRESLGTLSLEARVVTLVVGELLMFDMHNAFADAVDKIPIVGD